MTFNEFSLEKGTDLTQTSWYCHGLVSVISFCLYLKTRNENNIPLQDARNMDCSQKHSTLLAQLLDQYGHLEDLTVK